MLLLFFSMIVQYGFNYTGTIIVSQDQTSDHSKLFFEIMTVKIILSVVTSFISIILFLFFEITMSEFIRIYIASLLYLFAQSIYPEWFYHGLQRLSLGFFTIVIWKTLYIILIYFLVKNEADYLKVVELDSITFFISSLISIRLAVVKFKLKFVLPKANNLLYQLSSNWSIFFSSMLTNFYTKGNFLFLGYCVNPLEVALFSITERFIFTVNGLISLMNRIIFPYLSIYREDSEAKFRNIVYFLIKSIFLMGFALYLFSFIFSEKVSLWLSSTNSEKPIILIKILSLSFISSSFCTFATTTLIVMEKNSTIYKINLLGFFIGVFVVAPLTYKFGSLGLSIGFICNSFILTFTNLIILLRYNKDYNYAKQ